MPFPTAKPFIQPTPKPVPTPTAKPVPTPTDKPVPTPTDKPVPTPTDTPTDKPVPTPTDNPVPTPTEKPVPTPTDMPVPTPIVIVVSTGESSAGGGASASSGLPLGVAVAIAVAVLGIGSVAVVTCRRKSAAGQNNSDSIVERPTEEAGSDDLLKEVEMGAKSGAGGSMNFFRDAGFNASRAQELSSKFSARGFETPSDLCETDDAEMSDTVLAELSMLAPEIRKFRAAVAKLREPAGKEPGGGDVEMGDVEMGAPMPVGPHDVECLAFLKTANFVEIFPRIKAEAGGNITIEKMCNPDFVSDKMLVDFKLNKAQIRRFRRAVDDHAKEAKAANVTNRAAAEPTMDQKDADAKAKGKRAKAAAKALEQAGGGNGTDAPMDAPKDMDLDKEDKAGTRI